MEKNADNQLTLSSIATEIPNAKYAFGKIDPEGEPVSNVTVNENSHIYLYYKRDRYKLITVAGKNIASVRSTGLSTGTSNDYKDENNNEFMQNRKEMITNYKYDETVTITAEMEEIPGYECEFAGWSVAESGVESTQNEAIDLGPRFNRTQKETIITMPKANIKIIANANKVPNSYSVIFDANTGEGTMENQGFVYDSAQPIKLNTFTKPGYSFKCWNTKADGTGTEYGNNESVKNLAEKGSITLYAQWKPVEYKLVFNANGGSGTMNPQVLKYGELTQINENKFTRTGYTFNKWTLTQKGDEQGYGNNEPVLNLSEVEDAEVILYAQWTPNTYTVNFNANSGTGDVMAEQGFTYDAEKALAKNTYEKTGYTFDGWSTTPTGTVEYTDTQIVKNLVTEPKGKITLYAIWSKNKYTVIYNSNAQQDIVTGTMEPSTHEVDTPKCLTKNSYIRTGYTFKNWTLNADGTGASFEDGEEVENLSKVANGKVTVYAQWTANTYTIEFDPNTGTGENIEALTCTYDKTVTLKKNTYEKTGYSFIGWRIVPNLADLEAPTEEESKIYNDEESVTKLVAQNNGKIILYAQWQANTDTKYTVTHYVRNTSGDFSILEENLKGITDSELILANLVKTTSEYNVPYGIYFKKLNIDGKTVAEANTRGEYTENSNGDDAEGTNEESTENTIQILANKATTIKPDGSLQIEIYYERTYGNLTVVAGDNNVKDVFATEGENKISINNRKFYYGESVPELTATIRRQNGYVITFQEWESSNTTFLPSIQDNPSGTFIWPAMPANTNITLTAKTTKVESDDIQYVVNHYLESPNGSGYSLYKTIDKYGTTNSTITEDMVKINIPNSKFKESDITGTTISENGDTVVNLWYTRNEYTLKIKGEKNITQIEESTTEGKNVDNQEPISIEKRLKWGADINIEATLENETGYTYEFTGWVTTSTANLGKGYNENNKSTTITMPAEDMEITATASKTANKYKVKFNANTGAGKMEDQEFTYNEPQRLRPNDFKKEGYTFKGWVDAETLSKLNAEPPTLTLEQAMAQGKLYVENETEDGKQGAEVSNLTSENGKTINLYAIWEDETAPVLTLETSSTTNSIEVNVTTVETGSGIAGNYKYYIGTMQNEVENENDGTEGNNDVTQKIVYSEPVEKAGTVHIFEGLTDNTTYYIKVEVYDNAGNLGKVEVLGDSGNMETVDNIKVNTLELVGDVTFSDEYWSNGKYVVTVNTTAKDENGETYAIQYQVLTAEEIEELTSKGTTQEEIEAGAGVQEAKWQGETITSGKAIGNGSVILKDGDILYARISDGVNATKNYSTKTITNPAPKTYTDTELAQLTYGTEPFNILTDKTKSDGFTVYIENEITGVETYNYYAKEINEEEYKLVSTSTNYNDMADVSNALLQKTTFKGETQLQENHTYKVKVVTCAINEKTGNATYTQCVNTATIITSNSANPGQVYEQNKTYIDSNNYTAIIPAGFSVSDKSNENKISSGMVLKDVSGNEFVWVPVNQAKYIEGATAIPNTSANGIKTPYYKPMAIQQGNSEYYEGILYSYDTNQMSSYRNTGWKIGANTYREPSLLTNKGEDGYTWNVSNTPVGTEYDVNKNYYLNILAFSSIQEYGNYINKEYTNMVNSTDNYGGFYISRYETSAKKETVDAGNGETKEVYKVQSKPNEKPMSEMNWYKLYFNQDSNRNENSTYYGNKSVTSSMLWGSQYDSMLNWILTGGEKAKLLETSGGNQTNFQTNTAQFSTDIINNIYDLMGNTYEWTQEASSNTIRATRGGSFENNKLQSAVSRTANLTPNGFGVAYGTRLQLYIKGTEDVTGPEIKIEETKTEVSTATVKVWAKDSGSGVAKYIYEISKDGGTTWEQHYEGYVTEHTFTNLIQNSTYTIKVQAVDGKGNRSVAELKEVTTELILFTSDYINEKYLEGLSGNAVLELEIDEKALQENEELWAQYENKGYKIEYQVVLGEEAVLDGRVEDTQNGIYTSFTEDGTWVIGNKIVKLHNKDVVYARLTDGINATETIKVCNIDGLKGGMEYFSSKYTETTKIECPEGSGNYAYIPADFKVGISPGINSIEEGLVIQDDKGNEFVWVPVANALHTGTESIAPTTSTYKPMAVKQNGYNDYYESILYDFDETAESENYSHANTNVANKIGGNGIREPSLVTNSASDGYTWDLESLPNGVAGNHHDVFSDYYKKAMNFTIPTEYGKYKNEEYKNMIESVQYYGGFYIGRYETSLGSNKEVASKNGEKSGLNVMLCSSGLPSYGYGMLYYQDSNRYENNPYYRNTSVTSSTMWNAQYDAMMNWLLQNDNNKGKVFSTELGNHTTAIQKSGNNGDDIVNNIYDLGGNALEMTQGSYGTNNYIFRGGYYYKSTSWVGNYPMKYRVASNINANENWKGSRMSLYLTKPEDPNKTEDEQKPTIGLVSGPIQTTNTIYVKVKATDVDSGIEKYHYYIKGEGESDYTEYLAWGNSYTFNVIENTTYNIYVTVEDKAGNVSNPLQIEPVTTNQLSPISGIQLLRVYGSNIINNDGEITGNGHLYVQIDETAKQEGYYMEYQIVHEKADFNEEGTWTKSTNGSYTIKGIAEGDIVYVRLNDGKKNASQYLTFEINELERFENKEAEATEKEEGVWYKYTDGNGDSAIIPSGFSVGANSINGINTISTGLVVQDPDGNQYVWIPVNKDEVIYDPEVNGLITTGTDDEKRYTYKPMVQYQNGDKAKENGYYESIIYAFNTPGAWESDQNNIWKDYSRIRDLTNATIGEEKGTIITHKVPSSDYREPSLVTGARNTSWVPGGGTGCDDSETYYKKAGFTSASEMGPYMNSEYTNMINSVIEYGGFYVGRFETSLKTENGIKIVQSKLNQPVMGAEGGNGDTWYGEYYKQESKINPDNPYNDSKYSGSKSPVVSSMIWGSQYDRMINWIVGSSNAETREMAYKWTGNHTGGRVNTGSFGCDVVNNIFDLAANQFEWTQEAGSTYGRVLRGGYYNTTNTNVAWSRNNNNPTNGNNNNGSRIAL